MTWSECTSSNVLFGTSSNGWGSKDHFTAEYLNNTVGYEPKNVKKPDNVEFITEWD